MKDPDGDLGMSVTVIDCCLIITLADEMSDAVIDAVMKTLTEKASESTISGAILNFSMVRVMDSYTFNAFKDITEALALMGINVVWAGLSPGVVCALMDLNVETDSVSVLTAGSLERGLALLKEMRR